MKIRFYHWWIYNLYHYFWTPILTNNPKMLNAIIDHQTKWVREHKDKP